MSVNNSLLPRLAKVRYRGTEAKYLVPVASGAEDRRLQPYRAYERQRRRHDAQPRCLNEDGDALRDQRPQVLGDVGSLADIIILFTMTATGQEASRRERFHRRHDKPGSHAGKKEPKLGIRASATSEIIFDNYLCPVENRLGEEGEGFKIAMAVLDAGRIGIASQAVGIAEAALEASVVQLEREAFGQKIGEFQMIQQKLADMKTRVWKPAGCSSIKRRWRRWPRANWRALHDGSQHGQALRQRNGHVGNHASGADSRWYGLQQGAAGRAVFPRRQDHRDLRRHQRDPADGHRPIPDRAALASFHCDLN
jgi:hypothetical protein